MDPSLHEMVLLVPPAVIPRHQACGREAESPEVSAEAMVITAFPRRAVMQINAFDDGTARWHGTARCSVALQLNGVRLPGANVRKVVLVQPQQESC